MSRIIDLTGKTFGRWTVLERAENKVYDSGLVRVQWKCECSCKKNTIRNVSGDNLRRGKSNSCGCYRKEQVSKLFKRYNTYDLEGRCGIGYTRKGEEFYFDLEDYDLIKDHCWHMCSEGYLTARIKNKTIKMHRLIMEFPKHKLVDHANHLTHDNMKSNLRIATHSENIMNSKSRRNSTSKYKGVSIVASNKKSWKAQICVKGKKLHLGYFDTEEEGALAYNKSAMKYFGEFAYLNDIEKKDENSQ